MRDTHTLVSQVAVMRGGDSNEIETGETQPMQLDKPGIVKKINGSLCIQSSPKEAESTLRGNSLHFGATDDLPKYVVENDYVTIPY